MGVNKQFGYYNYFIKFKKYLVDDEKSKHKRQEPDNVNKGNLKNYGDRKITKSLKMLEELIGKGREFPDAIFEVSEQINLCNKGVMSLEKAYDKI